MRKKTRIGATKHINSTYHAYAELSFNMFIRAVELLRNYYIFNRI